MTQCLGKLRDMPVLVGHSGIKSQSPKSYPGLPLLIPYFMCFPPVSLLSVIFSNVHIYLANQVVKFSRTWIISFTSFDLAQASLSFWTLLFTVGHTSRINGGCRQHLFAQIGVDKEIERQWENSTKRGKKKIRNKINKPKDCF